MSSQLRITEVGLLVSAALAVGYAGIVFTCLIVFGLEATDSLRALLLGIGWRELVGMEIGLLAVTLAGFLVAVVVVPPYNLVRRRRGRASAGAVGPGQARGPSVRSWRVGLLAGCFALPVLVLLVAQALTPVSGGVALSAARVPNENTASPARPVNLGSAINTALRETEPSFTADGRTMYFNCQNADICVSHLVGTWEEGRWTEAERLVAPISTDYDEVEPVINASGDKLYFASNRPGGVLQGVPFLSPLTTVLSVGNRLAAARLGRTVFGGLGLPDVWVSDRVDGVWSEPRNLSDIAGEPPVNTEFADHCVFFSADGEEVFWTSNRPGGFGNNDIWTSRRVGGIWTQPENLGPKINGPGSEHTSIPTPDGRSLYITTTRDEGFGGEDIYLSTRDAAGRWGPLVNLGPLVNGTGDDRCPAWTPDLKIFLFDSVRDGGYGSKDIWWLYFTDVVAAQISANGS